MRRPSHAHRGRRHHQPQRNKACMLGQCHRDHRRRARHGGWGPHPTSQLACGFACCRQLQASHRTCAFVSMDRKRPVANCKPSCLRLHAWKRLACLHLFPGNSQGSV
jgi:hypothetical protein